MSAAAVRLRREYATALRRHLGDPGEATLHDAYRLGREAVAAGVGLLDLTAAHHDLLLQALADRPADGALATVTAAAPFLAEALSPYEMVRRGYHEAAFEAAVERRHAATLRRLSALLSDASLASDRMQPLVEVLMLVAEAATDLLDARGCLVAVRRAAAPPWTAAWTPGERFAGPEQDLHRHLLAVQVLLEAEGPAVRLSGAELWRHAQVAQVGGAEPPMSWLGAPLCGLDGRLLGLVEVVDWLHGPPTELDEALVVHLAQMAAAALERSELYR